MLNALKHEILVVDDDAAIRDSLALVLKSGGYDATTAVNGFDALLQLKRRAPCHCAVRPEHAANVRV